MIFWWHYWYISYFLRLPSPISWRQRLSFLHFLRHFAFWFFFSPPSSSLLFSFSLLSFQADERVCAYYLPPLFIIRCLHFMMLLLLFSPFLSFLLMLDYVDIIDARCHYFDYWLFRLPSFISFSLSLTPCWWYFLRRCAIKSVLPTYASFHHYSSPFSFASFSDDDIIMIILMMMPSLAFISSLAFIIIYFDYWFLHFLSRFAILIISLIILFIDADDAFMPFSFFSSSLYLLFFCCLMPPCYHFLWCHLLLLFTPEARRWAARVPPRLRLSREARRDANITDCRRVVCALLSDERRLSFRHYFPMIIFHIIFFLLYAIINIDAASSMLYAMRWFSRVIFAPHFLMQNTPLLLAFRRFIFFSLLRAARRKGTLCHFLLCHARYEYAMPRYHYERTLWAIYVD